MKNNKLGLCVPNWKDQANNTDSVRAVISAGDTHSQKCSNSKIVLISRVKI